VLACQALFAGHHGVLLTNAVFASYFVRGVQPCSVAQAATTEAAASTRTSPRKQPPATEGVVTPTSYNWIEPWLNIGFRRAYHKTHEQHNPPARIRNVEWQQLMLRECVAVHVGCRFIACLVTREDWEPRIGGMLMQFLHGGTKYVNAPVAGLTMQRMVRGMTGAQQRGMTEVGEALSRMLAQEVDWQQFIVRMVTDGPLYCDRSNYTGCSGLDSGGRWIPGEGLVVKVRAYLRQEWLRDPSPRMLSPSRCLSTVIRWSASQHKKLISMEARWPHRSVLVSR
jgi:hypothetical protein